MTKTNERAVVVTTAHKGVFFGYTEDAAEAKVITLKRARCCVYWSSDVHGFMGLAGGGPTRGCRVGPSVPSITLQDVTATLDASPEAVAAWERGFWG
jgi:hypothetical protein